MVDDKPPLSEVNPVLQNVEGYMLLAYQGPREAPRNLLWVSRKKYTTLGTQI